VIGFCFLVAATPKSQYCKMGYVFAMSGLINGRQTAYSMNA
jgi:hypothetical protein